MTENRQDWRQQAKDWTARARTRLHDWAHGIRPGLRFLVGLLLICGGIVGFLPILGFWMLPLGIFVAGLDVALLWRRLRPPAPDDRGEDDGDG